MTTLFETLLWYVTGLTGFAIVGLATWIALREVEVPRVGKWSLVLAAPLASWIFVESVAWLVLTFLSLAGVFWILRCSSDRHLRRSFLLGAALWAGIGLFPFWHFFGMATFERRIVAAVDGEIRPDSAGAVDWDLRRFGGDLAWLRHQPAAVNAHCSRTLFPNGACCRVDYADGRNSEIHIFRTGLGRYTVRKLTDPSYGLCRNPRFDPTVHPGSSTGGEFVPCDPSRFNL